ncbi:EpsG family protein [Enterobacter hormaechei subsp. xiangfangensis]|nr:EpsG family protein [Enterobacter hormaechei subsp. xiangfangensis]
MNANLFLTLTLFIINPMLGTLSSIIVLARIESISIFLISLMGGITAYNLVPYETMDLATHYYKFEALKGINYYFIFDEGINVLFYFYMKALGDLGFNKEWVPFFSTFFGYFFLLTSLKRNLPASLRDSTRIYLYLLWFLTISFLSLSNGIRSGLSSALFIYALQYAYNKKMFKAILWGIISTLVHSFVAPLLFIIIVINFLNKFFSKRMLKICLIACIVVSGFVGVLAILENIISSLSFIPYIDQIYKIYIVGDRWGSSAEFDLNTRIAQFITQLPFFFSVFILLISNRKNIIFITAILISCISIITFQFWVISERYQYVTILTTTFYLISKESTFLLPKRFLLLTLFILQIIVTIWAFYRFRYMIIPSIAFITYPFLFCFYRTLDLSKLIKV